MTADTRLSIDWPVAYVGLLFDGTASASKNSAQSGCEPCEMPVQLTGDERFSSLVLNSFNEG